MDYLKIYFELFWAFFKIGGLTFGGGLTMLPMLEHELVQNKHWVTEDELLDCYAIGQCTPGIIAVNTATFVGYKKARISGGIVSTLGMIAPSVVIITAVAAFLKNYMDNVWFQHALMGVRGVVCALLINTVINLGKKSLISKEAWIIGCLVLLAGLFLNIPTVLLVISAAVVGIVLDQVKGGKDHD